MTEEWKKHESFGVIEISRVSSSGSVLVGSEISHQHYFSLVVKEAEQISRYGEVSYHGHKELIRVHLSANQLVDMISMMNISNATPCTIRHVEGKQREQPPKMKPRIQDAADFGAEKIKKDLASTKKTIEEISELVAGLPKKKQEQVIALARSLEGAMHSNARFYLERIAEATEKSIQVAKTEVESFVANLARQIGIKSLKQLAPSENKDSDQRSD